VTGYFNGTVDFDPGSGVKNITSTVGQNLFIQKLDINGDLKWVKTFGSNTNSSHGHSIYTDNNNNIYLTGKFAGTMDFDPELGITNKVSNSGSTDAFVLKLSQNLVTGTAFIDFNQNCIDEDNEIGIAGRTVTINPGNITATTSNNGVWGIKSLPIGSYTATIDSSPYWLPTCPTTLNFFVPSVVFPSTASSFGFLATTPCPAPDISIYPATLRPGFSNKVYIHACNEQTGVASIDSAYVIVELDSLLTPTTSSIPFTSLGNNLYRVEVDTIYPGFCVDFWLGCQLSTSAILGQTLCTKAQIYPVEACIFDTIPNPYPIGFSPCNTNYDQSHIEIQSLCDTDTIRFIVSNTGSGDMSCYAPLRLYIDGVLDLIDSVQLLSGNSTIFSYQGDGRTWRLETNQHPLHPGNSNPSNTIELCGDSTNWTSNLVNIMPLDDADPNVDIFCDIVRASYDPNDKTGFPLGIGSSHDILPNQELEYVIRFQNTGTDSALFVVVVDTLPLELDVSSLRIEASSHDYFLQINNTNVLLFFFNYIYLPDSNTNEPASHGFIKFKIKQSPNLPNGTTIENSANIYFDINPPVPTNTTLHTIKEEVITLSLDKKIEEQLKIKIYPNPTEGLIFIEKEDNKEISFHVIDNLGQSLISKTSCDNIISIDLTLLTSGLYYIYINNGKQTATQKIIKQ